MIYDCFTFFNEFDLLKIRLNELKDVVDKVIICESTTTHSGKPKELNFLKVVDDYKDFDITYLVHKGIEGVEDAWQNETDQRNHLIEGLKNCFEDDIIILSDLDEIPNPETIRNFDGKSGFYCLEMQPTYYYLNTLCAAKWYHGKIFSYKSIDRPLSDIRLGKPDGIIRNAGLHCSYTGGVNRIVYKLDSFAHQEFNTEEYNKEVDISNKINNLQDLYSGARLTVRDPKKMDYFPKYVLDNFEQFNYLIEPSYNKGFNPYKMR